MDAEAGDDSVNLVEAKIAVPSKENDKWKMISKIFDRLMFLTLVIVYIVMILTLIPESYGSGLNLDTIDSEEKESQ